MAAAESLELTQGEQCTVPNLPGDAMANLADLMSAKIIYEYNPRPNPSVGDDSQLDDSGFDLDESIYDADPDYS
jgi:hypothetical protein